jgi:DNA-binding MarR family transcriptional regulator
MNNTETAEANATWRAFLEAGSIVLKALGQEMERDQHLPLPWFEVLAWLSNAADGRLRMRELADSVYLSNSGLTRLLDRMSAAGLIERQICDQDRRGWYAAITPRGREVFRRVLPGHRLGVQSHFLGRLNDQDIRDLNRIMGKVIGKK